jgi:aspartokinase-like uncharacterized kinase
MVMTSGNHVVVKLGGSLAGFSAQLADFMAEIVAAAASGVAVVIVPGGGSFADAVRHAQLSGGFDDVTAHDMALLAMAQNGRLLASLPPHTARLVWGLHEVVVTLEEDNGIPLIWQPDPRCDGLELEHSWRVTSDSLALWLASKLGAHRVILVKRCAAPPSDEPLALAELSRLGIIDAAYPDLAASVNGVATTLIYAGQSAALKRALAVTS